MNRLLPNEQRLSCAAELCFSQMQFDHEGRRQLQPLVRLPDHGFQPQRPVHRIDILTSNGCHAAAVSQGNPCPELTMALNAEINVTPMIDVLLVLLVVFMISIQFRSLLPLNVPPPADRSKPGRASPQVVLELNEDGSYAINGTVTPLDVLSSRLTELAAGGQRNLIFVRAAPKRSYGDVIRAVDLAKGAGFGIVGYMP
jgi:biopolymer transport protein ExbD